MYAVITDQPPDTSVILSEQTDNSYVTFAGRANLDLSIQITVGTGVVPGQLTLDDGQQVDYDNRDVRLGVTHYFFVRLYSSQVGAGTCAIHGLSLTVCSSYPGCNKI